MRRCGIVLKPSTLLHFHHVLTKRKYHMLFSSKRGGRPGPKGPAQELIDAVVEMKRRNPTWGCPRIAQQITFAFGVDIDKGVVRRILGKHYGLESGSGGPSWLTFLGQAKDSLWSIDLFRCESLSLRTHWLLVVMDQFTRRIIGFGTHRGTFDGPLRSSVAEVSQHRQRSVVSVPPMAGQPSSVGGDGDQDRTLRAVRIPYVPLSHPYVERLVGTLRRECLDRTLFWTSADLEAKLREFQKYFNEHRTHAGIEGRLPDSGAPGSPMSFASYRWQKHCRGLYQAPIAA
jgi:transposase InsO family protein